MTKITAKQKNAFYAAGDELAAANPDAFLSLQALINNLMNSAASVEVPVKGTKKTAKRTVEDDFSDDADFAEEGEEEEEENGEDDFEEEGEEGEEEEGEADEGEEVSLDDLTAEDISSYFENVEIEDGFVHDSIGNAGLRELAAAATEFTFDPAAIYKDAKVKTPADKKAALVEILNRCYLTIDAISEFDVGDIIRIAEEESAEQDEPYEPLAKGRPAAKLAHAANGLFVAIMKNLSE